MYIPLLPQYVPTSWVPGVDLSDKNLNHSETQYSLMKAIIDGHHHDDEIDTKTLADSTFFSLTHMGSGSGFDADKIDGLDFSDLVVAVLPVGSIIGFKGTDAQIPTGWKICDGGGGTTDFRDRFIIGAGGAYALGWTGGPGAYNGTITPTGSVTVGAHTLITAEIPSHVHSYTEYYCPITGQGYNYSGTCAHGVTSRSIPIGNQSSGGGSHGHTGSSISFTVVDPRPLYYALYLIKKVS